MLWTRFLQSVFPNSSFVIIERHPVAVSLATEKWSPTGLISLVEHWLVAHETFEKDRAHLKRVMTIKYENLISQPLATLTTIYKFLGPGTAPHHFPGHFRAQSEATSRNGSSWRKIRGPAPPFRNASTRYEPRVRAFGYSLQDLELL